MPGLGGAALGGRRARAEVTEESVPFLEIVSEPLVQGKVRGAMASSLISLASSSRVLLRRWYNRTRPAISTNPTKVPTTAPATTAALDPEKALVSERGHLPVPYSLKFHYSAITMTFYPSVC